MHGFIQAWYVFLKDRTSSAVKFKVAWISVLSNSAFLKRSFCHVLVMF